MHGLATFAWDAGDEAGLRLAAVQLVRLRAVSQAQAAAAFGVDPVTVWRWDQALAAGGVAGLVPARRGPKGASKLTPRLVQRIAGLDAAGAALSEIAAATGVSTFSVRNALGRVAACGRPAATADSGGLVTGDDEERPGTAVPVLPDPVPRTGSGRWPGGAARRGRRADVRPRCPVSAGRAAAGAARAGSDRAAGRGPAGLWPTKDGFYGLAATLLTLAFLALAGEPRAEGATRVPPAALGRVLGLDRAPEVKTIRRKLASSPLPAGGGPDHGAGPPDAAARPRALGFLHVDGHARVYYGTRTVQKTHIARLKFPAPATGETWVTSQDGEPVFMVVAEPSDSLAGSCACCSRSCARSSARAAG